MPPRLATTRNHVTNGFDLLRLLAASAVVFGHSFPLTGHPAKQYMANFVHAIAVKVFFVISGYLITQSWKADPDLYRFALRRLLRIVPGYVLILSITVFLVGPALTSLNLQTYFTNPNTLRYFTYNLGFYPDYTLPGLFSGNTYPSAVNGSFWTLPVELLMYATVPLLIGKKLETSKLAVLISLGVVLSLKLFFIHEDPARARIIIYGTDIGQAIEVGFYFQLGCVYALFDLAVYRRAFLSILLFLIPGYLPFNGMSGEITMMLVLPFAVISLGTIHFKWLESLLRKNDISYGLYLYGFLVQQVVQSIFQNRLTPFNNFIISLPITAVVASISWFLVEKQA